MIVNKITFFVTMMSHHVKFGETVMLQNQQSKTITLRAINQVKSFYLKRGFKLSTL